MSTDPKLPLENGSPVSDVQPPQDGASTAVLDPPSQNSAPQHNSAQQWLHRTSVFLFVLISAVAGVLLVILPWTPEWTDNYLLLQYPLVRSFINTGFFRGLCTGLGLLDIWIGFWEALHYQDRH